MRRKTVFSLVIVILVLAWAFTLFSADAPTGSTYSSKPEGTQAFYETLERLEYSVERLRHPFASLSGRAPGDALIVVSLPDPPVATGLRRWVEKGNTLIYFASRTSVKDSIYTEFDVSLAPQKEMSIEWLLKNAFRKEGRFACPAESPIDCSGIQNLSDTSLFPFTKAAGAIPVRTASGMTTAVLIKAGKGQAWIFADSEPILNQSIDQYDNFSLLYSIVKGHGAILFDEFHHGFIAPSKGAAAEGMNLLLWFSIYFLLLLVAAAVSRAIRFGPPRQPDEAPPSASTEFVRSLGLLYSGRQVREVLKFYVDSWHTRAASLIGGAVNRSPEQVVDILLNKGIIDAKQGRDVRLALVTLTSDREIDADEGEYAVQVLEESLFDQREGQRFKGI